MDTSIEICNEEGVFADVEAPKGTRFRINAKKFLLTYSQVPENLSPEEVVNQLTKSTGMGKYVVSWERHKDGRKHFHVILLSDKKVDVRSTKRFNLSFERKTYKCNCKRINQLGGAVDYVCKDKEYITNIDEILDGYYLTRSEYLLEMCDKMGVEETAEYFLMKYPEEVLEGKGMSYLVRNLRAVDDVKQKMRALTRTREPSVFTLDDFNLPDVVKQWRKDGFQLTSILVGEAAKGLSYDNSIAASTRLEKITLQNRT